MSVFSDGYQSSLNRESRNLREPVSSTGFLDNVVASYNHFINEDQSISRLRAMSPEMDTNFESYQKTTGKPAPEQAWAIRHISASDANLYRRAAQGDEEALSVVNRRGHMKGWQAWRFWDDVAKQYPDNIRNYDAMVNDASNKLAEERQKNQEVMQQADGLGKVGQFTGAMGGAMTDPINVATLGFGASVSMAKGLGNAYKLAELSAKGFAISAGTEALIQPHVYKFKKEIGAEYSASQAIENILIAGAGGALLTALPTATKLTYKGFKKNIDSAAFKLKYSIDQGKVGGIEAKASLDAVRALQQALEQNPFKELDPSINGVKTHLTALEKATMDFRQGNIADVSAIVKPIDDAQYPAWGQLETAKQALRKESNVMIGDPSLTQRDFDIYAEELQGLKQSDAVEKVKTELMTTSKLKARQAKKEAKKFVESRTQELEGRLSGLERDLGPAAQAQQSKQVLTKIRAAESAGKKPQEIMEMVKKQRPELATATPKIKPSRRVKQEEPSAEQVAQQRQQEKVLLAEAPPKAPAKLTQEQLEAIEIEEAQAAIERAEIPREKRESTTQRNQDLDDDQRRLLDRQEDLEIRIIDLANNKLIKKGERGALIRKGMREIKKDVLTGSTLKEALISASRSQDVHVVDAIEHVRAVLDANKEIIDLDAPSRIRREAAEATSQAGEIPPAPEYQAYKSESQAANKVQQSANEMLYSDIDDIDLINQKALQDVEARLAEEDFFIPDQDGNLVSARQVLDEAIKGVDNAAEVRACFIG